VGCRSLTRAELKGSGDDAFTTERPLLPGVRSGHERSKSLRTASMIGVMSSASSRDFQEPGRTLESYFQHQVDEVEGMLTMRSEMDWIDWASKGADAALSGSLSVPVVASLKTGNTTKKPHKKAKDITRRAVFEDVEEGERMRREKRRDMFAGTGSGAGSGAGSRRRTDREIREDLEDSLRELSRNPDLEEELERRVARHKRAVRMRYSCVGKDFISQNIQRSGTSMTCRDASIDVDERDSRWEERMHRVELQRKREDEVRDKKRVAVMEKIERAGRLEDEKRRMEAIMRADLSRLKGSDILFVLNIVDEWETWKERNEVFSKSSEKSGLTGKRKTLQKIFFLPNHRLKGLIMKKVQSQLIAWRRKKRPNTHKDQERKSPATATLMQQQ
jgi:hypothetical protein